MERMLVAAAHPELDRHESGAGHPERHGRLDAAVEGLQSLDLGDDIDWLPPRSAAMEELSTVHDLGYLDALADLCAAGGGRLDPDTSASAGSWETARLTAGAGLAAVDALAAGGGRAAFVMGRPPGHHATRSVGMGFCLVNNVAVAAAALTRHGQRVAIFDWDVHHGNGTQDIFWTDPQVLYLSIHQWPLYPGTGRPTDRGADAGLGTTVNLPLPPGATGDAYLALFDEVVAPQVEAFAPDWVFISAGFDAHRDDPLAGMSLTAGDFADLTARVAGLSQPGRLVLFLEGGYDLSAVRASVGACAARLVGHAYRPEPASAGGGGMDLVAAYRAAFNREDAEP
jgi:acetoin utilization deacetylase AcuC-like enzyme